MPKAFISHSGGRPMKPIPDDAPVGVVQLAQALRDLVDESMPEGVPTGAIAAAAGIGKSTLFHALSGQRLPSLDTVLTVVNTCRSARAEPDFWVRDSDGSLTVIEAKSQAIDPETQEKWKALWEQARHPESAVYLMAQPGAGKASILQLDKEEPLAAEAIAYSGDGTTAPESEQVSVTDAQAELDRAMRDLQGALRDVTKAKAALEQAIARDRATLLATAQERLARAGVDAELLRSAFAKDQLHTAPRN
jgi:hypothetical protein